MKETKKEIGKVESPTDIKVPTTFTDVLYLTNRGQMPSEIRRLLRQKKLSFSTMPIGQYHQLGDPGELIGTVIVDAEDLDALAQQRLARVIESLEMAHVGVILLTGRVELPVRSFSLAPTETTFSLASTVESVSIDDLWVRISLNLAYRKRGSGFVVKPAPPANQVERVHRNSLGDQLEATGALVGNLTEQLRMAGLVQRDFLPRHLPNCEEVQWAAVFLPAEWVSGDIYDVARIDEQHIGFYVADAVGHGMPAALLTIFVKQALVMRETLKDNYRIFAPAEVMKNLNVRMAGQKLSGHQFATCCYCLLNTKTLELTYARAGHPYPILIRSGKQPEQLEIRGSLLAVFENAEYTQQTIQLQPGDKLLLYSDGAESLIGSFNDMSGFSYNEGFCKIKDLPLTEMMGQINTLAQTQEVDQSQVDDITIVGLEIS